MADTSRLRAALAALLLAGVVSAQNVLQPPKVDRPVASPAALPDPLLSSDDVPSPPSAVPVIPLPKIDPRAALKDLLPTAPKLVKTAIYTGDDLRRVPELRFEATPEKELTTEQWRKRKAHTAAAALHLNAKDEDGFLKAMLKGRTDLAGVPFAMGEACRSKRPRAIAFGLAASVIQHSDEDNVWKKHDEMMTAVEQDGGTEDYGGAFIAVVRQKMGPANEKSRKAMVKYFASVSRPEATRELAQMAVFSTQKAVRKEALEALAVRRERDYTAVLVAALTYPWPAVARNAAEAIVKLERKDLMPNLIDMLEATDPRGPVTDGKKVTTARELVRVNHHHNCMLCHAPAERASIPDDILVAEVPIPTEPLTPPAQGYGNSGSNLLVRIDVTYLRQDFSVMQAVDEKGKWPAMQRFDFVVRKRELSPTESDELRAKLEEREPGVLSPYQKAAVHALREMTGRDFEAKAGPWRKHLKLKGS